MRLILLVTIAAFASGVSHSPEPRATWSQTAQDLRFTPDGRYIVARTFAGVLICEVPKGTVRGRCTAGDSSLIPIPAGMDVSPDSRHVAFVTHGRLFIARVPDGAKEIEKQLSSGAAAVAFNPDGKSLAVDYAALEIRRASDLVRQTSLPHGDHWGAETIAFSPDGRILASGGFGVGGSVIQLWDTKTWTQPESLRTALPCVRSLAFSRDGRHLCAGGLGVITVWDVARRSETWHRNFGHSAGQFIALSPDDRWLVTGKAPGAAMVLRAQDGEIAWEWAAHDSNGVRTAAFSPDGHWLATSGFQQPVRVWDFEEFLRIRPR